jgi:hypothetical protein
MGMKKMQWRMGIGIAGVCLLATGAFAYETINFAAKLAKRYGNDYANIQYEMEFFIKGTGVSNIQSSDKGPVDVLLRRTEALLDELALMPGAPDLAIERSEFNALKTQAAGKSTDKTLFNKICEVRRRVAMKNPLLNFNDLIFTAYESGKPQFHSHHMGFFAKSDKGAGLYRVEDFKGTTPKVKDMLEDHAVSAGRLAGKKLTNKNPAWKGRAGFQTPELSFDGQKIMFAWCEWAADNDDSKEGGYTNGKFMLPKKFRVFEMNLDGTNLRHVADYTEPYDDYDPLYLPNGRILIVSDRHNGGQRCGNTAVSGNMYTMKADGSNFERISWHETNERCPTLTQNGDLVYSRWDYIDRHAYSSQCMWLSGTDGTNPRAWHGMYMEDDKPFHPIAECDVMPIPKSPGQFVAIESGHHYSYRGNPVIIDISKQGGVDKQISWFLSGRSNTDLMGDQGHFTESARYNQKVRKRNRMLQTPVPLNKDFIIMCEFREILLIDKFRNEILLFDASDFTGLAVCDPIPVKSRPVPPVVASKYDISKPHKERPKAVISVLDIYETDRPFPQNVKITHLRICQILGRPKEPWGTTSNVAHGWSNGALLKQVLGTVPVESDGSVYFEAPIEREIFFQAVDSTGMAVTSMLSGTYVHAGEHLTCIGCHEDKWKAHSVTTVRKALNRPPSKITPEVSGSLPFNYHQLAMPVFKKHCVACHSNNPSAPSFDYWDVNPSADKLNSNGEACGGTTPGLNGAKVTVGDLEEYVDYYNAAYKKAYCADINNDEEKGTDNYGHYLGEPGNPRSRSIPMGIGARASKLTQILQSTNHNGKGVDLLNMLNYEEFHRITLWMDLNSNELGTYSLDIADLKAQREGITVWPQWLGGSGVDKDNPQGVQLEHDGSIPDAPVSNQITHAGIVLSKPSVAMGNGRVWVSGLNFSEIEVVVTDLAGRLLSKQFCNVVNHQTSFSLANHSKQSAGVYVIKLNAPRSQWSQTLKLAALKQ